MDDFGQIEEFDTDGALEDASGRLEDSYNRSGFLKRAGVGAGAVLGGTAFAGALPALAGAAGIPASDIAILNFALTLEYLEAQFYAEANQNKFLKGEYVRFSAVVAQHEASHVAFLKKVLGSKAVAKPKFDFKDSVTDQAKFAATAQALEDTGVHAYLGQVPNIKAKAVLVGAGRILPVEARHASWIRDIRFSGGTSSPETPAPAGFEDGFSKSKILAAVKATGFIVG